MNLTPQQLLVLTQLTDSMFPSGGFVHSEGLESYVQAGEVTQIEQLENLLTTRLLHDWANQDFIALHFAMFAYHKGDMGLIQQVDDRLTAMKIVKETRLSSSRVGRQTLRTVLMLMDNPFLQEYQTKIQSKTMLGHQAIVFGLVTAAVDIDIEPALTAYAYNLLSAQVSVAIKLMRIGQTQAQQLLWHIQPIAEQAVDYAMSNDFQDMQSFVPAMDIYGMQHEYLFRRLFNS